MDCGENRCEKTVDYTDQSVLDIILFGFGYLLVEFDVIVDYPEKGGPEY
jgi:hypothetical protein